MRVCVCVCVCAHVRERVCMCVYYRESMHGEGTGLYVHSAWRERVQVGASEAGCVYTGVAKQLLS